MLAENECKDCHCDQYNIFFSDEFFSLFDLWKKLVNKDAAKKVRLC